MKLLLEIKKILELDDSDRYYLWTCNLSTLNEGCASFYTNSEKKIKVFEGSGDCSDDKVMSYEEFIKNYDFVLRSE